MENPKYQAIFNTGKLLFWKHGVKRVTIEEICKEANVSKMTFYKFFPNKIELAKIILTDLMETTVKKFNNIVASNIPFSKKLEAIFLLKMDALNDFSKEFINDIYTNSTLGLKDFLEEKSSQFQGEIINFYTDAQASGNIRKEVNINFIIAYSSKIQMFLEDEVLMAQYNTPADFILEMMNMLFYGITTGNE